MVSGLLQGKSIVIIGGTSGMGLSAAKACIAAGARVIAVGRKPEVAREAEEQLGKEASILVGDAVEETTAAEAIALAVEKYGRFDGLYHVAGGSGRRWGDGPLHEITAEGWQATVDLNLKSVFLSNRAAIGRFLQDDRGGVILNMTSVLGYAPSPGFFATHAYAASKAAIIGLTRSAAAYYAPRGIRVNAVAPGLVRTPMARRAAGDEAIMRAVRRRQPLEGGRIGQPEDVDAAAVYFLSDASNFVTGQVLAIDGGWSVCDGIEDGRERSDEPA